MGARKQKWTAEEELALKAGIAKYGTGKWSTILKDPEYRGILYLRSNVDLKDKWRNLRSGFGSRATARLALESSRRSSKQEDNPTALDAIVKEEIIDDEPLALSTQPLEITASMRSDAEPRAVSNDPLQITASERSDVKPLAVSTESLHTTAPKRTEAKLETLILEAIANLKEPTGSNQTDISMYIESHYISPPDFKRVLSRKLKRMRETGKLVKVKHKYRIPPSYGFSDGRRTKVAFAEGTKRETFKTVKKIKPLNKPQVDAELARMMHMDREEAAAAAAQAVAEAEVAMADAEEAMRQAEAAEARAEEAQAVAEAAALAVKNSTAAIKWAGITT